MSPVHTDHHNFGSRIWGRCPKDGGGGFRSCFQQFLSHPLTTHTVDRPTHRSPLPALRRAQGRRGPRSVHLPRWVSFHFLAWVKHRPKRIRSIWLDRQGLVALIAKYFEQFAHSVGERLLLKSIQRGLNGFFQVFVVWHNLTPSVFLGC